MPPYQVTVILSNGKSDSWRVNGPFSEALGTATDFASSLAKDGIAVSITIAPWIETKEHLEMKLKAEKGS